MKSMHREAAWAARMLFRAAVLGVAGAILMQTAWLTLRAFRNEPPEIQTPKTHLWKSDRNSIKK